ncbi:MAG TPA: hypothetical protein VHU84_02260 [Lacipirellulaceae bacterium]|jgi:hypothetical protein|nr:hypothetical protein [Lacipirellulaceae bacterium]
MANEASTNWQEFFQKWPAGLPKRGQLVSTLNETLPFKSFMIRGNMLLLERMNPDAGGARFIMLGFDAIHMLKITDPLKEDVFAKAGFEGHFAKM